MTQSPLQWLAKPVEGKEDYYRIVQDIFTPGAEYYGLAQVNGSNKVILSKQPGEWRLEYVPADVSIYKTYKSVPFSNFTIVLGTNFLHKDSSPDSCYWSKPSSWEGAWGKRGETAFDVDTEQWCLNDFA